MSDRGMKKWAPFSSLIEQKSYLNNELKKKEKKAKPTVSTEQAESINRILSTYNGQKLLITYFENDDIKTISSTIKRIDVLNKRLVLSNQKTVQFKNLINLENV